ncbi:hypothetical protein SAMD00023353_0201070 [Rosellinia necatrix]|uniref:Uncharacterized protein n=1 Tax=Rosellinia necatrix TaxID=77044 RepID=A0A1S7UM53_ROSNE|nr:hypothetical protein SAMD00023353_0201070 [Rosellinia necatrix]
MAADAQVPEPRGWFNLRQRLETKDVDPQLSSPLYARIPPEIRDLIFELAVTEFASPKARTIKSDAFVQESHDLMPIPESAGPSTVEESISERFRNQIQGIVRPRHHMRPYTREHSREPRDGFDWLRFDNTEPMKVGTTLLLTCRRAYLEAHSLPLLRTEQRFYCHRGPYSGNSEGSRVDIGKFITNRLSNPAPVPGLYQKDLVRSVRLFTQQFWLEDTFLQFVNTSVWFANLEHLRITLRRSDWWDWERNAVPRVNPFRGNCYHGHTVGLMHQDMEAETGNVEFREGAWGKAFSHMLKLKTLTIDFETSEDKRDDMETIVTWALRWRFPLANGRHLSTGGQTASKMSWRGLPHHWSDKCVSCDKFVRNSPPGQDCPKCKETRQLFSQRYGPQLLVWTCLWTPV